MNKVMLVNGGEAVIAEYKEQFISEYCGNPFIEALPPIYSQEEVVEKLAIYPPYNEKERELDKQYKVHVVQRLFQVFQPLMIHLDLESRISRIIRQGYLARNPFDPKYISTFQEGYDAIQNMNYDLNSNEFFRSTALGLSIVGISGIGKTTAINRIIGMYPQIIVHSKYKNTKFSMYQLTWLKIDCPHDGSVKGLCVDFFLKIDSLLGTDYYRKFGQSRLSVNTMLPVMAQVAKNCGLGVLIIDEIQHLNGASSGGSDKMLNFFVKLVNTFGVSTIFVGTPKALSVLQSEFRQARRGSGQGDMVWDRLKKDQGWELLLNAIWDYQWTRKTTPLSREISDIMYEESQGITDIAVKLYAMSQTRAIISGKEEITPDLIKEVASENLRLVKPMLDALKTGDIRKIAKYEDVSTVDTDFLGFIERERQTIDLEMKIEALKRTQRKKEQEVKMSNKEEALLKLLGLNIDTDMAQNIVEKILEQNDKLEVNEIVIKAIQEISSPQKKKGKTRNIENANENDIRVIAEQGRKNSLSGYESLKEKGIIKDYKDDFLKLGEVI
ncbi:ATP-binding protein [Clostridium kluyveri]|uniref:ATP-binding protein n=1 Tax=Clostridium kluyveri TaxID=1534 RepID=UPI002246A90E|nr:ATP-binding protein [Clostridium kluyveri]UZQ52429.1 ATP-binding protein [Clostridium kluyveri]